jgi:hypothetical protein
VFSLPNQVAINPEPDKSGSENPEPIEAVGDNPKQHETTELSALAMR